MTRPDHRTGSLRATRRIRPGRRELLLGSGLLAAGALSACASEVEPPAAPVTGPELEAPTPVQTEEQLSTAISEIHEAVAAADKKRSAKPLDPRVVGSAQEFRSKLYKLIKKSKGFAEDLELPGASMVVPLTSVDAEFPRTAIALVEDAGDSGVPFFMALRQESAKDPYTTWGWAQQAVGVEMPDVANALVGSQQVGPDADDLLMTPMAALKLYAKVLSDGDEADPDDKLADDPFKVQTHKNIAQERKELNTGVDYDEAATIKEVWTVREEDFVGLRTDEGGALVMSTITSKRTVRIKERGTMRYEEENPYTKAAGTREFNENFIRTFGTHVAVHIPPKGAKGKIQPVGATQTVLGVTGE